MTSPHAQVLSVPGRCFPVDVVHSLEDHTRDYMQAAIDTAIDIHAEQPEGQDSSGVCGPRFANLQRICIDLAALSCRT